MGSLGKFCVIFFFFFTIDLHCDSQRKISDGSELPLILIFIICIFVYDYFAFCINWKFKPYLSICATQHYSLFTVYFHSHTPKIVLFVYIAVYLKKKKSSEIFSFPEIWLVRKPQTEAEKSHFSFRDESALFQFKRFQFNQMLFDPCVINNNFTL